jgi:1,4-alpha-glucan branching enzyme
MSGNKKEVGAIVQHSGVSFRVWAPFADTVAVTGSFNGWSETPLESEEDGYWAGTVHDAKAGQEYKFVVKNGDNTYHRNDPRALHFTTAAGNSVLVDTHFDWEDDNFQAPPLEEQVIYELHVGTFNRPDPEVTGTFDTVCDKLDYLADLGINMIELMPINTMLQDRGWGYAIDYIFAIESLYGGRYGFLQFVKAAHARGIGVIVDVVYNHFGPDSNMDLWQFDGWNENGQGGIYFYNDWRAETPWGNTRPDFGRPEVQQYITDNVKMWLHDCRVDGLRVDSTIFIRNVKGQNDDPANDLPDGWHILQEINSIARKINPAAITIAEDVAANEYIVKPQSDGGAGFKAQWELGYPGVLREVLASDDISKINLSSICNELGRGYNGDTFQRVIYTDSHDSAANGSARLNEVIAPGEADNLFARKQSIIAAGLLLTTPGIPMLFQGQEFMENGAFNDWEGIDWEKAERNRLITDAYRHLIVLRKNHAHVSAGLTGRSINLLHTDGVNKVVGYHRWKDGGPRDDVMVIINFANQLHEMYELAWPRDGLWKVRFSAWPAYGSDAKNVTVDDVTVENGKGTIVVPPSSVLVLSQDE